MLYNESPETVRDWHDAECRINISGRCADLGQIFKQRNEHTEIFFTFMQLGRLCLRIAGTTDCRQSADLCRCTGYVDGAGG